jgi:hypothetical protein
MKAESQLSIFCFSLRGTIKVERLGRKVRIMRAPQIKRRDGCRNRLSLFRSSFLLRFSPRRTPECVVTRSEEAVLQPEHFSRMVPKASHSTQPFGSASRIVPTGTLPPKQQFAGVIFVPIGTLGIAFAQPSFDPHSTSRLSPTAIHFMLRLNSGFRDNLWDALLQLPIKKAA